jgi:predicted branched-subunit amino acid permease
VSSRPVTIVIAAALEALIGLAAAASGVYSLFTAITGQASDLTSAIPLTALGLGAGALLVFVARGLWQLRDWARTPVFVTQLFLAVVAYYMFTSEQYALAAVLAVVAVCASAAVLSPPTTAALFPDERGK